MKTQIDKDALIDLCREFTYNEVAKKLNCSIRTINNRVKKYGINRYSINYGHFPTELTKNQEDFIEGCLLGDGHISKPHSINCRFNLIQSITRLEFVQCAKTKLFPFINDVKLSNHTIPIKKNGIIIGRSSDKRSKCCYVTTVKNSLFSH